MSKNGSIARRVVELNRGPPDLIALAAEEHVSAIDVDVTGQPRPLERAHQLQIGAGDDVLQQIVLGPQRSTAQKSAHRRPAEALARPTMTSPRPRSAPKSKMLTPVAKSFVYSASCTVTSPRSVNASTVPSSPRSASTVAFNHGDELCGIPQRHVLPDQRHVDATGPIALDADAAAEGAPARHRCARSARRGSRRVNQT